MIDLFSKAWNWVKGLLGGSGHKSGRDTITHTVTVTGTGNTTAGRDINNG